MDNSVTETGNTLSIPNEAVTGAVKPDKQDFGEEPTNSAQNADSEKEQQVMDDGDMNIIEKDCVKLSDSIMMYSKDPLCSSAHVYRGLLKSGIFGYQKIAVKYLPLNEENIREANVIHDLGSHPNVVTLFHADIHRAGPFPAMYIAMERCQTLNLHDRIIQNKKDNVPFDPDMSLSQSKQVAVGVDFIHRKGIIYRDLKPQNILISEDGKSMKIADFGLSKPLKKGRSVTKQSMRGIGTDGYRAPETYNDDVISQSSDIYSLAFVFYFIWSNGYHPFGDDPDDWNSNIKKNRDRDLTRILIKDKDSARNLLEWMLQFLPRNRPTTMQILKHVAFNRTGTLQETSTREDLPMPTEPMERMNLKVIERNTSGEGTTPSSNQQISNRTSTTQAVRAAAMTSTSQPVQNEWIMTEKEALEALLEEEQCQEFISDGKYVQALIKLNGLAQRGRNDLSTRLMIAECNLLIGREKVAETVIAGIRQEMLSQNWKIQEYQALVDENTIKSFHVREMIMLPCLCELIASKWPPNSAIDHIERCISKMKKAIKTLVAKKGRWVIIAYQIGFPSIQNMLECFRTVEATKPDMRAVEEARCLNSIGDCYDAVDQYHKAIACREESIDIMRQQFGEWASKYMIFGGLLHNAGVSKRGIGKYGEANEYFEQAIQAGKEATDFSSEEDRQKSIELTLNASLLNNRLR